MSFRVYARRVRDRDVPFVRRHRALRDAAGCYHPLGFDGTWAHLRTAGDVRNDEAALLRALEMLEASRAVWLTEMESFANRRRSEKAMHRRTPRQEETRYLHGWRWPGPQAKQAMLSEVDRLWAVHARAPFPDVPSVDKGDLAELDTWLAGCISTYLANKGELDTDRRDILVTNLPELRRHVARLGYPQVHFAGFDSFRRLLKMTELIVNDTAREAWNYSG
ncbi:hypothetical protein [Streptomyces sp. NBC_01314]|uniref:hypothetical protein n=1 Tax=Streptomyces sp. NBC_01314 TaxID=2903821 RepID=UPI003087D605|nr:hypothetical protein OG622_01495 [Streptomyces sp. NBC_01314]